MKKENYLPFDLEIALKHPERVVTRDGRKVQELYLFKTVKELDEQPLYGVIEGYDISAWRINGSYSINKKYENDKDLFLLPEVKECWVNVYDDGNGKFLLGVQYKHQSDALDSISELLPYIKTIRIDNSLE